MLYPLRRTRQIALAINGLASSQLEVAFVVLESVIWPSVLTGTVLFFEMAALRSKFWADEVRQ